MSAKSRTACGLNIFFPAMWFRAWMKQKSSSWVSQWVVGGAGFPWMELMVGVGFLLFFVLAFWNWIVGLVFVVFDFPPLFLCVSGCVWSGGVGRFLVVLIVMLSVHVLLVELELMMIEMLFVLALQVDTLEEVLESGGGAISLHFEVRALIGYL